MANEAYKDHRAGSRKGDVHRLFDTKGKDVARTYGEKKGLALGTLHSWFSEWSRDGKAKKAKPVAKAEAAPKGKAVKAKAKAKAPAKAERVKAKAKPAKAKAKRVAPDAEGATA